MVATQRTVTIVGAPGRPNVYGLVDVRGALRVDNVMAEEYLSRAGLVGDGRRVTILVEGLWE